jgi:hypothetical protein
MPPQRLWVNPDCGLKTRGWPETEAALSNRVQAAKTLRQKLADNRASTTATRACHSQAKGQEAKYNGAIESRSER